MDPLSFQHKKKFWFGDPDSLSADIIIKNPPDIPFKRDPTDFTQSKLTPLHIFQYLPKDHDCYIYADIFKQLDFSLLFKNYSPLGQHAYNPALISSILIYSYCHGIFSSRQIERKCHTDLGFMYISHMNCPNFRVLSDFRKNNLEFFKYLFNQTVSIAQELKLIDLRNVCQDGSKFEADTSKHKAMSYGRMVKKVDDLSELIRELLIKIENIENIEDDYELLDDYKNLKHELEFKETRLQKILAAKQALEARENEINPNEEIPDKAQISFADIEARIMGKKGEFDYCYNGQICVDSKNQIIVGQYLSQNANDKQEVEPGLLQILWNTERYPDSMSYDNGYFSGFNLEALTKFGVNAYIAVGREGKEEITDSELENGFYSKFNFIFSEDENLFICPEGQKLGLKSCDKEGKRTYSGNKEVCFNCPNRSRCCKSKKGQPRTITIDQYEPLRNEMRVKMKELSAKEIYKKRKIVVEPVFGQMKNQGFRRFHLRGFDKAGGEFALVCSAHNLKKVVKCLSIKISSGSKLTALNAFIPTNNYFKKLMSMNLIQQSVRIINFLPIVTMNDLENAVFKIFSHYPKTDLISKMWYSRTLS